ncbi:16343_t:CDS:2 [Dentiscutata erythropus]|uniref:16343_t:CDS:1 n=1 Tax=Dentiscutata erythropus TaxID=1348616 RepID=A0A9N8ZVB5_9GLOM|nr:16343_t:CDS:2 [Dentiscutata erythropus]
MSSNNNALSFVFVDPSRQISRQKLLEEIQILTDEISSLNSKISSLEAEISSLHQLV